MFALEPETEQNVLNPGLTRKCNTQKELEKGGGGGGRERRLARNLPRKGSLSTSQPKPARGVARCSVQDLS